MNWWPIFAWAFGMPAASLTLAVLVTLPLRRFSMSRYDTVKDPTCPMCGGSGQARVLPGGKFGRAPGPLRNLPWYIEMAPCPACQAMGRTPATVRN